MLTDPEASNPRFSLLLVDDDPSILASIKRTFRNENILLHTSSSGDEAIALLAEKEVHAAIIDFKMPQMDGISLLSLIRERFPDVMIVMLTGYGNISLAVQAMKLGAIDFLEKPVSSDALKARIGQLREIWELRNENKYLRKQLNKTAIFPNLIGESPSMRRLRQMILQIAPSDENVCIQGETGSGKEIVARCIHQASARSKRPFVPVDCASISETVIESELFGHLRGAFTGAYTSTIGLFRSADGGTLFLDEIGELPMMVQAKLLRTLQEREVRPVGSTKVYPVDVRIISATNQVLAEEIKSNHFREDLFYRLNTITIEVPSLRERREDVGLLANFFIEIYRIEQTTITSLSNDTLFYLENYDWPGNVRELENTIRRALVVGREEVMLPNDLPHSLLNDDHLTINNQTFLKHDTLAAYEKAAIENALKKSNGNRREAAKVLDIGEATLYRKIKLYKIM